MPNSAWAAIEKLWTGASGITKAILIPVVLLTFLFLSYVLSDLQGAVSRLVQAGVPPLL